MKSSLIQTGHPFFSSAQRATISRSPVKESGARPRPTACSPRDADETLTGQFRMKHAHVDVVLNEPEGEGQRPCSER
ncbi:hypothetical protein RGR602_PC00930 (plasmid) [Rhizobium gallicum bv. gallicum R602sp]|uniref:Uncharacterized protein n=1 Tax=Rhizobium gallicum bv. gallicum R602sp TaxID=1041138 RepID=A0A0B4XEC4_9HYPH|nr:hypothetical protein RGR602_PC00930 [Rhizobium gallicum bv. gallicum R602sp]